MIKDTGGPAFASGAILKARSRPGDPASEFIVTAREEPFHPGMTMRDFFAAAALQGMLANSNTTVYDAMGAVDASWAFADKMIELRAKS